MDLDKAIKVITIVASVSYIVFHAAKTVRIVGELT
jgi:hypothetical protein